MNRQNLQYVDELYQTFQNNPGELDPQWRAFFEGMEFGQDQEGGFSGEELKVYNLIQGYRQDGHLEADVNPLHRRQPSADSLKKYGLSEKDLEKTFACGELVGLKNASLKDILEKLQKMYCGTLTVQVSDAKQEVRDWFFEKFESPFEAFTAEKKQQICRQLIRTESLEKFFHTRFVGQKRFSIEGADSLIPMMEHLVEAGCGLGVKEVVIGMAHRGRINVLANFMDKGLDVILAEFTGVGKPEDIEGFDGDVKYHLGYSEDKKTKNGDCHISLAFNPSHLEAVNPVVLGMARAKQRLHQDTGERSKVVPVLIHGDAAFAGQGVVAETFQLSQVPGYTVGGTIHVILDNQVGFTTSPDSGRSSHYASDTGKILNSPVLHVNGDDTEACVRAMDFAIAFRQQFKADVVINVICYRRYGHNESDEPAFTQPLMYDIIKKHKTPREIYTEKVVGEKAVDPEWAENLYKEKIENLQNILDDVRNNPPLLSPLAFKGLWEGLRRATPDDFNSETNTGCSKSHLQKVAETLAQLPEGFNAHKKLQKLLKQRHEMLFETELVDWGMAELLSYGSLILEGTSVRLSGQDCGRGTFTHRHCLYYDTQSGERHNPLKTLNENAEFCVYDSILSEMAVVGFEYGNAIVDPTYLTIWEAQFGDFANGAQIIIDQFISSGESKWQRMCGLVFLLPHGYEGQGPEHSSARLERFLQLCAQDNMQVVNMTTPAQIFHVLRRQIKREFRKPLIVMSPKSLLRHPKVQSTVDSLVNGQFMEVIDDSAANAKKVDTVIFCSGKVYYELLEYRDELPDKERFALLRLEQISPFPAKDIQQIFKGYKNLKTVHWTQEEPKNMGAWNYVESHFSNILPEGVDFGYVGRTERASPATGSPKKHQEEQQELIKQSFAVDIK